MGDGSALCPRCGGRVAQGLRFCEQCGARLESETIAVPTKLGAAPAEAAEPTGDTISWERGVPLINNRFILWDFLWVVTASVLGLAVIVALIGLLAEGELLLIPLEILALVFGILAALFAVAVLLVYQNHFHMKFTVDAKQVVAVSGSKERKVNTVGRIVGVLALLAGRPGVLGSALLATSQEVTDITWREVHRVRYYPAQRVVSLSNSWRTVLRLYCSRENYDQVAALVERFAQTGAAWRDLHPASARPPLLHLNYRWALCAIAATVAGCVWQGDELAGYAIVAGLLVLLAGWFAGPPRRLLALLGLVAVVLLAYNLAVLALEVQEYIPRLWVYRGYEHQTNRLIVAVVGGAALLGMGLARLLGRAPATAPRWRQKRG